MVSLFCLFWTIWVFATPAPGIIREAHHQLCRSQIRQLGFMTTTFRTADGPVNPRVRCSSTAHRGAALASASGAKTFGTEQTTHRQHTRAQKRSFQRAQRRAEQCGGTWYKGRWHTVKSLNTERAGWSGISRRCGKREELDLQAARPERLRVMTYNLGGLSSESFDILLEWLVSSDPADILIFQETHWCFGQGESTWKSAGWQFITSADPGSRYSGVAIVLHPKLAKNSEITHVVWKPGRLLHARCRTHRASIDIVAVYQHVWQHAKQQEIAAKRHSLWLALGTLLQRIPLRDLVVMGADFNSTCAPVPGLVGRGLLQSATSSKREADDELQSLLSANNLVMLNTWGSSRAIHSHTFKNGSHVSQLDYVLTRRHAADAVARRARPMPIDLMPWRLGPKHRPVIASIPYRAGWHLQNSRPKASHTLQYSAPDLRRCLRSDTPQSRSFRARVQQTVRDSENSVTLGILNQRLLALCRETFPARNGAHARPSRAPATIAAIHSLWEVQFSDSQGNSGLHCTGAAWQRHAAVKQARSQVREARKQWLVSQIETAEKAAQRHDYRQVYQVVNRLAPKQSRERVYVKSPEGHLLCGQAQFQAIFDYFQEVFSRPEPFSMPTAANFPSFTEAEILSAIQRLKTGKAVPRTSPPTWRLCAEDFASRFSQLLQVDNTNTASLPPEATDCSLLLLAKPGKPHRQPGDLRPIGLQDPSSKLLATLLKDRVEAQASSCLARCPQYAYSTNRSIEEAISRVAAHCASVRSRIKASVMSVHQRRAGCKQSACVGGIMISIDLSRAFDALPRSALQASMDFANIDRETQYLILLIHERCQYRVEHAGYADTFSMGKGVRQGCCLSPILFAVYTAWIHHQLSQVTTPEWAEKSLTLFADDCHLSWALDDPDALGFVVDCVRKTFQLLRDCGMTINHDKSTVVVSLRGSTAKRWLRVRSQRVGAKVLINFGTPHQPIWIPKAPHMVYLGIVASYAGFEMQTVRYRLKIGAQTRQRLAKLLHSNVLSLTYRVRLYQACIRSTLLYGIHSVGITEAVLQRLESWDARALRSVAKSPVHLTRESNSCLRARLAILSPQQYLEKLLSRRAASVQDPDCAARFSAQLQTLRTQRELLVQGVPHSSLHLVTAERPVPCDVCGCYFASRRIMLTHRSRMHPDRPLLSSVLGHSLKESYTRHTVDGMPTCSHCGAAFKRVEALKKHLKAACPVLHHNDAPGAQDSEHGAQVPPAHEGLHKGHSCRPFRQAPR